MGASLSIPSDIQKIIDFFTKTLPVWFQDFVDFWQIVIKAITHPLAIFNLLLGAIIGAVGWICIMIASIPGLDYIVFGWEWWVKTLVFLLWYGLLITLYILKASVLSFWELLVRLFSGGSASSHFVDNINECHAPLGSWHALPLDNTYDKIRFGCKLPCGTGYFSSTKYDSFCRANPAWQPGLCPQQQIYRLMNNLGNVGALATIRSPQGSLTGDQTQAVANELANINNNLTYLTSCKNNAALSSYNQYIKTICMHNKTLGNNSAASVCNAFYCLLDGSDPTSTMCQKLMSSSSDTTQTQEDTSTPWTLVAAGTCTLLVIVTLLIVTVSRLQTQNLSVK